jgi:hypothetical protein
LSPTFLVFILPFGWKLCILLSMSILFTTFCISFNAKSGI